MKPVNNAQTTDGARLKIYEIKKSLQQQGISQTELHFQLRVQHVANSSSENFIFNILSNSDVDMNGQLYIISFLSLTD